MEERQKENAAPVFWASRGGSTSLVLHPLLEDSSTLEEILKTC